MAATEQRGGGFSQEFVRGYFSFREREWGGGEEQERAKKMGQWAEMDCRELLASFHTGPRF